ncbi:PIN domain-containing protein [Pedobacter cryophilus]|uniref:Type II toxin-antitoxin system VapC family toxin n=1 Tax=Pedobacter cryophilus TaxID=2571271 RepID=A0A4U1C3H2_9SPHI|nr:PIN domain-containing protein [Pedobacter cryophilus]TKB98659.1 type II toxin-antitoxin system VapC family toxin [Pedobacter cryophilus]
MTGNDIIIDTNVVIELFKGNTIMSILLIADKETANQYGLIKTQLLQKGKPIPENDIWIAATAKQHQIKLITLDKHFLEVEGILLEKI